MVIKADVKCYLCGGAEHCIRPGSVRDDKSLDILECSSCGLVFLSRTEIPEGFYQKSGMHNGELPPIEQWLHDTERDDERRFSSLNEAITNKDVLDFGCGAGGYLLKASAKAKKVMGVELETRLQPHFKANGLEVVEGIDELPPEQRFDLITAFHVIEHLEDPAVMIKDLSLKLNKGGKIIIELPSSADALLTLYNNEPFSNFTYWSCHLYLFNASNLAMLTKKAGLKLDYVKHIQRYPLSNHLYWLAKGKPGGHQVWSFLDSCQLNEAYEARLAALGITDTLIACLSC